MKTFLVKGKRPTIKWGMLPDNIFYEGEIPHKYSLAVTPSEGTIIIDVDVHDGKSGFDNIPEKLLNELYDTLNYKTKHNGRHFWFHYTGNIKLANKTSNKEIDLRTHKGYVVWYKKEDVRTQMKFVKDSSEQLNEWLESLFGYVE